jgi:hypothetical protein
MLKALLGSLAVLGGVWAVKLAGITNFDSFFNITSCSAKFQGHQGRNYWTEKGYYLFMMFKIRIILSFGETGSYILLLCLYIRSESLVLNT